MDVCVPGERYEVAFVVSDKYKLLLSHDDIEVGVLGAELPAVPIAGGLVTILGNLDERWG